MGRPAADAQPAGLAFAAQAGCTVAATAAACLRNTPESTLLDASAGLSSEEFTSGGPELPIPPAQAVASGRYTHVPILMGDNHDEGRTFAQGLAGLTEPQYTDLVTRPSWNCRTRWWCGGARSRASTRRWHPASRPGRPTPASG